MILFASSFLESGRVGGGPRCAGRWRAAEFSRWGRSFLISITTAPTPSAISGPVLEPVLLVPIISMMAFGEKPWPSPFFRPQSTPWGCRRRWRNSPLSCPPKFLSKTGLPALAQRSVIESPSNSRSMSPALASATNPSWRAPMRCVVCVKVAAVLARGGTTVIKFGYFASNALAVLSEAANLLRAALA